MLEGQVAVLSAGVLTRDQAVTLLDTLFSSEMYREDQHSFMLYPDRELTRFVDKNCIPKESVINSPVLTEMLEKRDHRIICVDGKGRYHFHSEFENNGYLAERVEKVKADYTHTTDQDWAAVFTLYEEVFNHKAFTGRSGTMFGYEGLGCIYWHMVSKLLLAVQENYQRAFKEDPSSDASKQLADYYYRVRDGIGFNKTPLNYGAFPTDPYSHTPKTGGAQQPGMTGQVKEEVITRFGELGLQVNQEGIVVVPSLLNTSEFLKEPALFHYQDVLTGNQSLEISEGELAFTYCQVPFVYQLGDKNVTTVEYRNGNSITRNNLNIGVLEAAALFERTGEVTCIRMTIECSLIRNEG